MPLLTSEEIGAYSPMLRGKIGYPLTRMLMRTLAIDRCNDLYDRNSHLSGPDFARAVLKDIGVSYEIYNQEVLDELPDGPFVTISNHPYGGIDGIILVDIFGHLREGYKVMVNRFLGRVESLKDSFICVTPNGDEKNSPTSDSIQGVKEALMHVRCGNPIGIFPSGAVSDLCLKDRCVRDRQWQEPVIRLIKKMNVPVLPIRFLDRNSDFYYSLGLIDWRVRLLRLPSEVFNKKGQCVRVSLGSLILPEDIQRYADTDALRDRLRASVYGLK